MGNPPATRYHGTVPATRTWALWLPTGDRLPLVLVRCRLLAPLVAVAIPLALVGQARAMEHVEVAEAGGLVATFKYEVTPDEYGGEKESALTLSISKAGSVIYSSDVRSPSCEVECAAAYDGPDVYVVTLEPGRPPDVVLEVSTDGAHCCYISQVFSGPGASGVTTLEHEFGGPRGRLEPLGPEGSDVFVAADDRFAYAFTDYADSGLPVQVWRLEGGVFQTVTRSYPSLIAADAAEQWRYFKARRNNDVGFFAAWAADEDLLGQSTLVSQRLSAELRRGRLRVSSVQARVGNGAGKRFARQLMADLRLWGYG